MFYTENVFVIFVACWVKFSRGMTMDSISLIGNIKIYNNSFSTTTTAVS